MYNSNWGYQGGKMRNARVRKTHEPVFVVKYTATPLENLEASATVLYRTGKNGYTALDWYDAPDPRPDYYRNLPSYFYNPNPDYGRDNELKAVMNRAEYIHKIAEYDRRKLDEYAAAKEAVTMREIQLEEEHEELLLFQEQTEAKQQSVEILLAQKNQELKNFESQIDTAQGQISEYEKDIQDQENKVKQLEAEIKRKEEEARKAAEAAGKTYNMVNLGDIRFIWPCPASRRITSGFGERSSPIGSGRMPLCR